jgi:hypothetical protein
MITTIYRSSITSYLRVEPARWDHGPDHLLGRETRGAFQMQQLWLFIATAPPERIEEWELMDPIRLRSRREHKRSRLWNVVVEFTFIPGTRDPETEKPLFRGRTSLPLQLPPSPSPPLSPFPFSFRGPFGLLCLTHYCLQVLTFLRSGLIRRPLVLESLCRSKIRAATGLVCAIVVT